MRIIDVEQNTPEWMEARKAKITGSKAKDIISKSGPSKEIIISKLESLEIPYTKYDTKDKLMKLLPREERLQVMVAERKLGFYQLIADRLAVESDDVDGMDRGHELEAESITEFAKATGLKVETTGLWVSEDNENIACSPDGAVKVKGKFKIAIESKSLGSAKHIQAYLTKEVPEEFLEQKIQYFVVNEDLEDLYFCFYDPRVTVLPFFFLKFKRKDLLDQIEFQKDYQIQALSEVDKIVEELSF